MRTLAVQFLEEGQTLQRKKVELHRKTISAPFFCENVSSAEDLNILCEMGGYSTTENDTLNLLGAAVYNIFNYQEVTSSWRSMLNQTTLNGKMAGAQFRHMDANKFKLIDPNIELFGISFKQPIYKYMRLRPPKILFDHMKKLILKDAKSDELHEQFWNNMFPEEGIERADAGSLINWSNKQEEKFGSDLYIPTVPFLTGRNCNALVDKAISMNTMAADIVDRDVATYFSLSADVFENRKVIQDVLNCIGESKNKVGIIKFTDPQNFVNISFSEHAQNNLSLFLKTLKLQNQNRENPMMMGTLAGGAFGYCLLGAGFDFFTDTVNNYQQYPMPTKGQKALYRKCFNDRRLVLESFAGIRSKFLEEGQDPMPYLPMQRGRYTREQLEKNQIDAAEWSRNCRFNGIGMWNEFTKELAEAIRTRTDSLFLDKIQRSAYAMLYTVINDVRNF